MDLSTVSAQARLLEHAQRLPAAPRLLAELSRLLGEASTDSAEIVSLLRRDAALAARILQAANSSFYAPAARVAAIDEAVLAVGFAEVHRIVGALAASSLGDRPLVRHGITSARYRANALFVATLMERFGASVRLEPGACYTLGLLRPIGPVLLERLADAEGRDIPVFAPERGDLLIEWQRRHWGIDGWRAAAGVLKEWQLPPEIVGALEEHAQAENPAEPIVALLQLAAAVAARDGYGLPGEYPRVDAGLLAAAGLSGAQFESAIERAEETFKRLRSSVV